MQKYKRRTFSGVVLEQEVFYTGAAPGRLRDFEPRPPMRTDEERARYNEAQSLKRFTRNINSTFTPDDYYATLTLDEAHVVDTFPEAKTIREKYIRSIQRAYPNAVIIVVMGRGKRGGRIHFHMLIAGVPRRAISQKWIWGRVKNIEHLREHNYYDRLDHGTDYTALAVYLFDHWTPEQGKGKRWRQTQTVRRPEAERPAAAKRRYSPGKPPAAPQGYVLVATRSTEWGYQYFKYIKMPVQTYGRRNC